MILFFGLYLGWFPISGHVPFLEPLSTASFDRPSRIFRSPYITLIMPALSQLAPTR